ncbi:hypothetical protein Cni_G10066 [Canna indica]|uniref:Cathepsin propeptide inhibitor domain-containing protein n=1 Tax=Canna indica TaxID=4628 RepID=A0AAQ3QAA8_9LILI|nr:hypothetical protein Cni_G10066 [Canna indica]
MSVGANFPFNKVDLASDKSLWALYELWQSHHGVPRSPDEKRMHFDIFKVNANYVFESNKNAKAYKLNLNKFGDMTKEEFRRTYTGLRVNTRHRSSIDGSFHYIAWSYSSSSTSRTMDLLTLLDDGNKNGLHDTVSQCHMEPSSQQLRMVLQQEKEEYKSY